MRGPPTLPPRLIGREGSAAYLEACATKFDQMEDRRMPPPKLIDRRKLSDVRALDAAVDQLPADGDDTHDTTWEDVDAT
jgi:hypothetical protein